MRRRASIIALAAALVLAVASVGVWYFVFRDDAPPAVNLREATASLDDDADRGGTSDGLDGTWSVDQSVGSFSNFTSSFVGFRVREQLVGIGAKTAVGRTPDVTGALELSGTTIDEATFEVDMTTLTTDDSRRDNAIRRQAIETSRFPTAEFALTQPIQLAALPAENERISVDATGTLMLHGVTRTVTIPLEAQRTNDVIAVVGNLTVKFADYSISKPSAASVLSVEDEGVIEIQLFFTRDR